MVKCHGRNILIILMVFLFFKCTGVDTTAWDRQDIINYQYDLVSDEYIESYIFRENGNVSATIGTKEAVAGPLMSWNINKDGSLIISDDSIKIRLKKITIVNDEAYVLQDGRKVKYKRSRYKK